MFFFDFSSNKVKTGISCYQHLFSPLVIKKKQYKTLSLLVFRKVYFFRKSNKFSEIQLITIDLASPKKIKEWAEKKLPNGKIFGQVTNPNTLHYKTLKPLKGGLFCERIFGPTKDFECACGIHKQKPFNRRINFQNKQFCMKCDVEYTWSDIRRYQLGYIELVTPITHLWYLKAMPSYIRSVLGAKKKYIEGIAYCSEIVTIDKAWKPNRLIPFPEQTSIINSKKKYILDDNSNNQPNYKKAKLIQKSNFLNLNEYFINRNFCNKLSKNKNNDLHDRDVPKLLLDNYNKKIIKPTDIKINEKIFLSLGPFFYNIQNSSYKNKIYFYKKICYYFFMCNLEHSFFKSRYTLKILYSSLSQSKFSFLKKQNFYNIHNIINLFNKKFLIFDNSNFSIVNKLKNKKIFNLIDLKKIYIQKNFIYFKTKKLRNLKIFNDLKLLTILCSNSLSYFYKKQNYLTFQDDNFTLKIDFFTKKLTVNYSKTLFSSSILVYLNIFLKEYLNNNFCLQYFNRLLNKMQLTVKRYDLFAIFVMPMPKIVDNIYFKWFLDSRQTSVLNLKEKEFIYDRSFLNSFKKNKKKNIFQNFSIYDEAGEIMWHKFWKILYFSISNGIFKKIRKIIKLYNTNFKKTSLVVKEIIKKIKFDKNFFRNIYSLKIKENKENIIIKERFSFFINLIKIYFKKTFFISQISLGNLKNKFLQNSLKVFYKFFKDNLKNKLKKFISLELLPWMLSQFLSFWWNKSEKFNKYNTTDNYFLRFNRKQIHFLNKIQQNSFFNYEQFNQLPSLKSVTKNSILKLFKRFNYQFMQKSNIYKKKIQKILKYRNFRLVLKFFVIKFFSIKNIRFSFNSSNLIDENLNNLPLKNLNNFIFLLYQKRWLLRKKQIFNNYILLKKDKFNRLNLSFFNKTVNFIYSSFLKQYLLIKVFSFKLKYFYDINFIKKNNVFFNSNLNRLDIFNNFKKISYFYSLICFYSKKINKLGLSSIKLNNKNFFFNVLSFVKFLKKKFFKNSRWLTNIPTFFYSLKILKYQKNLRQKLLFNFVKKYTIFKKYYNLINSLFCYYKSTLKLQNKKTILKLILKNKIFILNLLKKFQMKILNEIQKTYFYKLQKNKFFQIQLYIKNFKNHIIFINHTNSLSSKTNFIDKIVFASEWIYSNFKKFFYTSHYWQILLNMFKNRITYLKILYFLEKKGKYKDSRKFKFFINFYESTFLYNLGFNSFFRNSHFYNSIQLEPFYVDHFKKKNNILQIRQQYSRFLKTYNIFFLLNYKENWNNIINLSKKNKNLFCTFLFFLFYYPLQQNQQKQTIKLKIRENISFINVYLKFIKHDLNKHFNESIFSVISESRRHETSSMIWNNIYSLSNRYSWKSDIALNLFLGYILSPENPSDIIIPFYKKRIHNSNVLREEPPIAGGGIILQFLKEFDLPEMKKIDIQLQTILKKIPNKLNEIEILLKHYEKNIKFVKYYLIKKRGLIEIEKSILRKLKYIRRLHWVSARPEFMIIQNLPVLPADLRPIFKIQQQLTASDLNRLYQKVMYRNDRLKRFLKSSTTSNSFEMFFAQRMLQEAVDNLIENGKNMNSIELDTRGRPLKSLGELLKGKKGRFRQNLLGKRVDYSGRSVIVVGPKLKLHECGLPIEMAIELFLPFLIKDILKNKYALTVRSAKLFIKTHRIQITQLLRKIVKNQPILLNRAPTLHRLGIQAFLPKLVEGKAILLHPLVCSAFNADFDGDQMAVHVPIINEARIEAWRLILSRNNLLSPATGEPILLPSQDMVLGCYYLTIQDPKSFNNKEFKTFNKKTNKSFIIYNDFDKVLNAYEQNQIYLHTNIWVRFNYILESEQILQEPKEIQIRYAGQYIKIYSEYYQHLNKTGKLYNQIIKTTTGRILFNVMLNNFLT